MSDEQPAGRPHDESPAEGPPPPPYQEWPHQAPPGTEHRVKDPDAVSRGVRAAATIFGVAVVLHLVTLAAVKLMGGNEAGWLFIPEGLLVVFVGFIVAIIVTTKLPLDSRAPFWISGIAFMALSFVVWGVTCGLAL